MPSYTTRYAFYLAGGGSSGTITPDEVSDIDKLNDNFRAIDAALGIPRVASSASYPATPITNQVIANTGLDDWVTWNGTSYVTALPQHLSASALAAAYVAKGVYTDFDTRYFTQTDLLNGNKLDAVYPNKTVPKSVSRTMLPFQMYGVSATINATSADSDGSHTGFSGTVDIALPTGRFTNPIVVASLMRASSFDTHLTVKSVSATTVTLYLWSSNSVSGLTANMIAYEGTA